MTYTLSDIFLLITLIIYSASYSFVSSSTPAAIIAVIAIYLLSYLAYANEYKVDEGKKAETHKEDKEY